MKLAHLNLRGGGRGGARGGDREQQRGRQMRPPEKMKRLKAELYLRAPVLAASYQFCHRFRGRFITAHESSSEEAE